MIYVFDGFVRFDPETYMKQETANLMDDFRKEGIVIFGGGADSRDIIGWLESCGASGMSGTVTGIMVNEDELIRDSLARER